MLNCLSHKGRMTMMMIAIVLAPCKLQMCRSYVKIYCLCLEQRGEDEQRSKREWEGERLLPLFVCFGACDLFHFGRWGPFVFCSIINWFWVTCTQAQNPHSQREWAGEEGRRREGELLQRSHNSCCCYCCCCWLIILVLFRTAQRSFVASYFYQQPFCCCCCRCMRPKPAEMSVLSPLRRPSTACRLFYRHSFFAAVLCIYKDTRAFLQPRSQPQHDL